MRRYLASAVAALAAGVACLAATGAAGSGRSADAAVLAGGGQPGPARFNVGATHSPRLERLLAGAPARHPASASTMVQGIDVSSRQHPGGAAIDWGQVAAAGYKFAFVKATEGSYYVNPYYARDAAAARQAGMLVAAYHFAIPNDSPAVLQADLALDAAGDQTAAGQTLPLVVDLEYDPYASSDGTNECYGLSTSQMTAWISAFAREVRRRTGELPVIYTIQDWWKACTGGSQAFSADPLWVASAGTSPKLPLGWTSWEYWQFSSSATVPGIAVATDVSYFSAASPDVAVPGLASTGAGKTASLAVHALDAAAGQSLTWSASGLPPGLAIDASTGQITGTLPATPATYPVTVTATDAASHAQDVSFTWAVHGQARLTWPGRLSTAAGAAVNLPLAATDGLPGCSLTFTATGLPPGLSMSPCGRITGFATLPGTYAVTVHAGDSANSRLTSVSFRWTVGGTPAVAAGRLRLAVDDKCLAGLTKAGTLTPESWTCRQSAGQVWTLGENGTVRLSGKCLAALEISAGQAVAAMRTCSGRLAQVWRLSAAGGLANAQTGFTLCLTDPGASHVNGTVLDLEYCAGTAGQAWTVPPGPFAPDVPGQCLVARSGSPVTVGLVRCATSASQDWAFAPRGSIAYGHLCLNAARPATAGAPVTLAACAPGGAQTWHPMPGRTDPTGSFIVNPASGLCLAALPRPSGGSPLALADCESGKPRLVWRTS